MKKPIAPSTLLRRAARVISGVADEIMRSETVDGKWNLADALAKNEHAEFCQLATELRRLAKKLPVSGASFWDRKQRS